MLKDLPKKGNHCGLLTFTNGKNKLLDHIIRKFVNIFIDLVVWPRVPGFPVQKTVRSRDKKKDLSSLNGFDNFPRFFRLPFGQASNKTIRKILPRKKVLSGFVIRYG